MFSTYLLEKDRVIPLYKTKKYTSFYSIQVEARKPKDSVNYTLTHTAGYYRDLILSLLDMTGIVTYYLQEYSFNLIEAVEDLIVILLYDGHPKLLNEKEIKRLTAHAILNFLHNFSCPFNFSVRTKGDSSPLTEEEKNLIYTFLHRYGSSLQLEIYKKFRNEIVVRAVDDMLEIIEKNTPQELAEHAGCYIMDLPRKEFNTMYQCVMDTCTDNIGNIEYNE